MDWHQIYLEKRKEIKGWSFDTLIKTRMKRFKSSRPEKPVHYLELEYLLLNYDWRKTLIKKYIGEISEELQNEWLDKRLAENATATSKNHNLYKVLLPFYLMNPATNNDKIDKYFLNDQLLLILASIDHPFRQFRLKSFRIFEYLNMNFSKLNINLKRTILELLNLKTNPENILFIKKLVVNNLTFAGSNFFNKFLKTQLDKKLLTPKMAIGLIKRKSMMNRENLEGLKDLVLTLENGSHILKEINLEKSKMQKLLLEGPTMTEEEESKNYQKFRKYFNNWQIP